MLLCFFFCFEVCCAISDLIKVEEHAQLNNLTSENCSNSMGAREECNLRIYFYEWWKPRISTHFRNHFNKRNNNRMKQQIDLFTKLD